MTSIGFIGLGMMGSPLVRRLAAAGHLLHVCDRRVDVVSALADGSQVHAAESPAAVIAAAEVVFTCLPSVDAIRAVYEGEQGLLGAARPNTLVCELSTTSPQMSDEYASALAARGADFAEAPMIGPPSAAADGGLFFILGCGDAARAVLEPLFAVMGRASRHVGGVGMASRAKLLHNALGMIHATASAEVLGLCRKVGVDGDAFIEIIRQAALSRGVGYSTFFDLHAADILKGRDGGAGRLYIGAKD
ncbi:MAG: NAD(P)-dependent oxidoreductase, partial [Ramlibacter sp.]